MKRLFLFILMLMMLGSCVSLRKVRYLQESAYESMADSMVYQAVAPDYKIQPGDHLYVDVKNIDPKNMNPFQSTTNVNMQVSSEAGVYLNSYQVSDVGNIDFPLVGKVFVEGKTALEIQTDLQQIINEFFQLTTVSVKLINFRISLLGEVLSPGTFIVYQNNLNILQAISLGGDLTSYANRKEVKVIRKERDGTKIHKINLLKSDLLNSPAYYLQPGDIVYVEPLSGKNFTFTAFPYAILFSTISTTLLIISFLK